MPIAAVSAVVVTLVVWHCCFTRCWHLFQQWKKVQRRELQLLISHWPGGNVLASVSGSCFFSVFDSKNLQSEISKGYWSEESTKQQQQELSQKSPHKVSSRGNHVGLWVHFGWNSQSYRFCIVTGYFCSEDTSVIQLFFSPSYVRSGTERGEVHVLFFSAKTKLSTDVLWLRPFSWIDSLP